MNQRPAPSKFDVTAQSGLWGPMLRLSLPVLAEELMFLAVTWTDWWLTGHYMEGDAPKAAMGVMGYIMWLFPTFFAAVSIGATALVARHVGARNADDARRAANQALLLGTLFVLAISLAAAFFGRSLVGLTQLKGESLELAIQYFWIVVPVVPLIMISQVGSASLRGAGDMFSGFFAKLFVVVLNVFFSTALVTGWGPFPELGWQGIALGTAIGHATGGIVIGAILVVGRAGIKIDLGMLRPNWSVIGKLLRFGVPGGFDLMIIVFSQFVFVAIINRLGDGAAAAHGMAVQIEALAWMPGAAFQVAAATLAGQFLGARMPDKATQSVLTCLIAGGSIITVSGILLYLFGGWLTFFFTGDWNDPTSQSATELLKIIAFAMPPLATVMIISGALRGAGDTVSTLVISSVGFFVVRIPLALFLAWPFLGTESEPIIRGFDMGVHGAWIAMAIDLFVRAILIGYRFFHGGWKRIEV